MAIEVTAPEPRLGTRLVTLADVCDSALELLHRVTLSIPFVARRSWQPTSNFEDMGDPVVDVSPGLAYVIERESRGNWRRSPVVSILVRQRIDEADFDERLDRLMGFVEEIREAFAYNDLDLRYNTEPQRLRAIAIESDPVVVPEHLETLRQFTSGLLVSYTIID